MKYYRLPFATSGTRSTIPDTQPANGAINYSTGYSAVYQLDPDTDPLALRVERAQMNENFYQITDTLRNYYENTIPPFITSSDNGGVPFPYSKDSLVKLGGVVYSSNVAANTTTPPGASWTVVDMAIFNAKAPTASPVFTGTPTAPTVTIPFPANPLQIMNAQATADLLDYYGLSGVTPRLSTNLNNITANGILYFNNSTANIPQNPGADLGTVTTYFRGSTATATQVAYVNGDGNASELFIREKSSNAWQAWRRFWSDANADVIVDFGSNSNGYFEVYSSGKLVIFRTVTYTAGSSTLYALPMSAASVSGASGYAQLLGTSAPTGAMAINIGASNFSLDGPTSTVVVGITYPNGV